MTIALQADNWRHAKLHSTALLLRPGRGVLETVTALAVTAHPEVRPLLRFLE